ncbi:MAG: ABC transporter substrate-binding protein [Chloroflexota bacterium]|jgi:putative ABC transport system substrate-binding protein
MFKISRIIFMVMFMLVFSGCAPAAPAVENSPVPTQPTVAEAQPTPVEVQPTQVEVQPTEPPKKIVIGMMTIASHPSLDAVKQGVIDALKDAGFEAGVNVEFIERNAEGDIATLSTIAQQFIDENVDLIVATSTPAMQAAYNATKDLQGPPVFFNAVSNPYGAGIATAPDQHPAWVIGNQLLDPIGKTMELIQQIKPEAKVVGLIYNPAEANSVYLHELALKEAERLGITLEVATVANSSEVQVAAESLLSRDLDAFMGINDNTVSSGFEALAQVANDNKILLVGSSASFPARGAAASYGVNPYEEGLDSGRLIAAYLKGEVDIATAKIEIQDAVVLTVNPNGAALQGVELPADLVEKADRLIEE